MTTQPEPTNEQRRIIYQARRGLKELDFYIDPYVKQHYLLAEEEEQQTFARLLTHEDPDLLNFFMNQDMPEDAQEAALVLKLKKLQHGDQLA